MVDPTGDTEYEVERLVAKRTTGRGGHRVEYLVKWKGYPNVDGTWVAKSQLSCPDLLREFEQLNQQFDA